MGIVVIGGLTRLTGSGLSMVEWKPIVGLLPPLNDTEWQTAFEMYRKSPEYRYVNIGMTVEGFQSIFWLEYIHRMIGRFIGVAFFVPFVFFWLRGKIVKSLLPKLAGMFLLGGAQGALGWFMVASGLAEDPHVSPYRLTAHLGLAVIIFTYMLWVALGLLGYIREQKDSEHTALGRLALATTALAFVTILSGGLVAGLKAGFAYNTFPLMGGKVIPDGILALQPTWINFFDNIITAQFTHRVLAITVLTLVVVLWSKARSLALSQATRTAFNAMLAMAVVQVTLGISTLVMHVPIALASAHQAGAVLLLSTLLVVTHRIRSSNSEAVKNSAP